jgi:hypothetical protein
MAPSDWATCHTVIGPYSPVTNTINTTSPSCQPDMALSYNHLSYLEPATSHVILPSHLPSQLRYYQVTFLVSCHVNICTTQSPCHVSIRTTTCHLYCHMSAYHWATSTFRTTTCRIRTVPHVNFLLVHINP